MGRIPEQIIDQVQHATDIVAMVQSTIPLKRAGVNFKAPCPFHSEKTPSFVVSPSKQIYHCFGCGAGGNVFHFLMATEKISFIDAVKELAQKANIILPQTSQAPADSFQKTYTELYELASTFYVKQLSQHPKIIDYLKSRGLQPKTIQFFRLGFVPKTWSALIEAAKKKGYSEKQLERAGLAVEGRSGLHDRFVERILFPIYDIKGRVNAFGGRALGENMPKYLNSPETDYFKKRQTLYGLNWTKNDIIKENKVLVLEGYMDLIGLYQAGLKHCVATLGTALTSEHVRLLTRFAQEIIISYDGDKAGEGASLRGIDLFVQTGAQVRVLMLPQGFDPDDFILQNGVEAFQKLIDQAPYFLDYKLEKLCEQHDPTTPYGQRDIARGMLSLIGKMEDSLLRNAWIKKCAEKLRISEKVFESQLVTSSSQGEGRGEISSQTPQLSYKEPDLLSIESELVRILLEKPLLAEQASEELRKDDFNDPILRLCFAKIQGLIAEKAWNGISSLLSGIEDPKVVSFLSALSARPIETEKLDQAFQRTLARLRRRRLEEEIQVLSRKLTDVDRSAQDVNLLLKEILEKRKLLEKITS